MVGVEKVVINELEMVQVVEKCDVKSLQVNWENLKFLRVRICFEGEENADSLLRNLNVCNHGVKAN